MDYTGSATRLFADPDFDGKSEGREVISTVFTGVDSRMRSGYLLREVIDKIGSIHFNSSEELQTLGTLYEGMLREMRDAAGDSGARWGQSS